MCSSGDGFHVNLVRNLKTIYRFDCGLLNWPLIGKIISPFGDNDDDDKYDKETQENNMELLLFRVGMFCVCICCMKAQGAQTDRQTERKQRKANWREATNKTHIHTHRQHQERVVMFPFFFSFFLLVHCRDSGHLFWPWMLQHFLHCKCARCFVRFGPTRKRERQKLAHRKQRRGPSSCAPVQINDLPTATQTRTRPWLGFPGCCCCCCCYHELCHRHRRRRLCHHRHCSPALWCDYGNAGAHLVGKCACEPHHNGSARAHNLH